MKISFISILLLTMVAVAKETKQNDETPESKRMPTVTAVKINGTFEFKTQKVGKKTVVCGVALADGTYSYGGGSGAGASVSCIVVDSE